MSFFIEITETARADLECIYEYIAVNMQSPQNAKNQLNRLIDGINKLDELTERFSLYETNKPNLKNMRMVPVENFTVFYISDIKKGIVTIIRVASQRQDRKKLF